jgi:hypothetical protein
MVGSKSVTEAGPAKIKFFAVSTPRPLDPTIRTFNLMSLPIVSNPKVPIYLEYKLVSILTSS